MNAGEKQIRDYLCFAALEDNSTISLTHKGTFSVSIEYSIDDITWNTLDYSTSISLNTGDKVYLRGSNSKLGKDVNNYNYFAMTGKIEASGNTMSLLYKNDFETRTSLSSTMTLCHLFDGCASLTTPPKLPATSLQVYCYQYMFRNCTNLEYTPELPCKTSKNSMYARMFEGCKKITEAPVLPITSAGSNTMYQYMFQNCTNLNWVKCLAINFTGTNPTQSWMNGVQNNNGIFIKHIDATWTTTGNSGVPTNWTIIYYDPELDKYYTDQTRATECDDHGNPI